MIMICPSLKTAEEDDDDEAANEEKEEEQVTSPEACNLFSWDKINPEDVLMGRIPWYQCLSHADDDLASSYFSPDKKHNPLSKAQRKENVLKGNSCLKQKQTKEVHERAN